MINSKKGILVFIGIESIVLAAISTFLTIVYFKVSEGLLSLFKSNFLFFIIIPIIIVVLCLQMESVFLESKSRNTNDDQKFIIAGFLVIMVVSLTILFYAYQNNKSALPVSSNLINTTNNLSDDNTSSNNSISLPKGFQYSNEYITNNTLNSLDEMKIGIIRNEIYARNGYIFNDQIINNYFKNMDWYVPNPDYSDDMLNDIEKGNLAIINYYERSRGYSDDTPVFDNAYASSATSSDTYNCPKDYVLDKEYVTETFLKTLTRKSVEILRNEIYARHGYSFNDAGLKYYFDLQNWYEEDPNFSPDEFNEIENSNIIIILTHEKKMGWN